MVSGASIRHWMLSLNKQPEASMMELAGEGCAVRPNPPLHPTKGSGPSRFCSVLR